MYQRGGHRGWVTLIPNNIVCKIVVILKSILKLFSPLITLALPCPKKLSGKIGNGSLLFY